MQKNVAKTALKTLLLALATTAATTVTATTGADDFYEKVMGSAPPLPADIAQQPLSCNIGEAANPEKFRDATQAGYDKSGWESRIAADWNYFGEEARHGKLLVIDFARMPNRAEPAYRYLGNANSYDELYEPWSSSKVMAITGTMARLRAQGLPGNSSVGDLPMADLLTSIHSYEPFGTANGDSNSIATYFVNTAGREYLTGLFQQDWLKLSNPDVRIRGAYGADPLAPEPAIWQGGGKRTELSSFRPSDTDPLYQSYRCDECGLTGNKPATLLAQAEWLKRLAAHERDTGTRHPGLLSSDIHTLFYGSGHSDSERPVGGMMQGIGTMLHTALAAAISGEQPPAPAERNAWAKTILDEATDGQWRVFQKIGWGYSGTRTADEAVSLAHVCLPGYQGGREFTVAARANVPGEPGEKEGQAAALQLQALFDESMAKLLTKG